jgi:hypothetical protein
VKGTKERKIQREKERERRVCNGRKGGSTGIQVETVSANEETKRREEKERCLRKVTRAADNRESEKTEVTGL